MSRLGTLHIYKNHIKAGFTEEQAEALLRGLDEVAQGYVTNIEFKHECDMMKSDFKFEMELMRKDLKWIWLTVVLVGSISAIPVIQGFLK